MNREVPAAPPLPGREPPPVVAPSTRSVSGPTPAIVTSSPAFVRPSSSATRSPIPDYTGPASPDRRRLVTADEAADPEDAVK